jgi:hypothetical protein
MPSTSPAITARIEALQVRLASARIDLVDDARMRREVLGAQLVLHPGGRQTLRAPERRGAHDDVVSALLLACDPTTVQKLPCSGGDVVVRRSPVRWGEGGLSGGEARYFARAKNGALVPREPPYGTRAYEKWAIGMIASGYSTLSIERWQREQRQGDEGG